MRRRVFEITCLVIVASAAPVRCAADGAPAVASAQIDRLAEALSGAWSGRAEKTPRGPMNYPIEYRPLPGGGLRGTARPGDGTTKHVWTFRKGSDGRLRLEFLSTFGGNTETMHLPLVKIEKDTFIFRHPRKNFLEVRLDLAANEIVKRIILRGKAHVRIRLKRKS